MNARSSRWNPRRGRAPPVPVFARLLMALLLAARQRLPVPGRGTRPDRGALCDSDLRDPFGIAYWPEFRGRDGSRTPMPWESDAPHAGFTTGPEPWLPIPEPHRALAVDCHERDGDGSCSTGIRRFLAWRRQHPALVRGLLYLLDLPEPLIGFVRELDGERILALFNISAHPAHANLGNPSVPAPHAGIRLPRALPRQRRRANRARRHSSR